MTRREWLPDANLDVRLVLELPEAPEAAAIAAAAARRSGLLLACSVCRRPAPAGSHRCAGCGGHRFDLRREG